jgi:hypothetical protein
MHIHTFTNVLLHLRVRVMGPPKLNVQKRAVLYFGGNEFFGYSFCIFVLFIPLLRLLFILIPYIPFIPFIVSLSSTSSPAAAAISHKFDAQFRIGTPGREHSTHLSTQLFGIRQLRPGITRPSKAIEHQTHTNRPLDALVALAGAGCRELLLRRDSQSVRETHLAYSARM